MSAGTSTGTTHTAGQETSGIDCDTPRDATTGTLATSALRSRRMIILIPKSKHLKIAAGEDSGKKMYRRSAGTNIGTTPDIVTTPDPLHDNIHIKEETEDDLTTLPVPFTSSIKRERFRCGACGENFYYEKYFLEHVQEHHKTPARVEAASGTDKLTAGQETSGVECETPCDDTTGTLATSALRSQRMIILISKSKQLNIPAGEDSGKKMYRCDVCSYTAKRKYQLKTHSRLHTGVLLLACTQCDYSCIREYQLKLHVAMKHTGEKPYKCNVCSFATPNKYDIKRHSRLHTGKLPYSCSSCDFKCNTTSGLKYHTAVKHTGEKPYKCNVCNYATILKSRLTVHSRVHTGNLPYSCSSCDHKCNTKQQLEYHTMMKHTGEKPYMCNICSYGTAKKNNLTRHSKIHTGNLPYSCSSCDFKCNNKKKLKLHITKHVREKP